MSITYNGDVVSCLSKRSWCSEIEVVGDLIIGDLKTLWETRFHDERFGKCKCCRDCIKYPKTKPITPMTLEWETEGLKFPDLKFPDRPCDDQKVYVYSAFPPSIAVYAAFPPSQTIFYGIRDPKSGWTKTDNTIPDPNETQ
jgi:hypothetical protein